MFTTEYERLCAKNRNAHGYGPESAMANMIHLLKVRSAFSNFWAEPGDKAIVYFEAWMVKPPSESCVDNVPQCKKV